MARKTEPVTTQELSEAIEAIRSATSAGAEVGERIFKTLTSDQIQWAREGLFDLLNAQADLQKLLRSVLTLHIQRQDAKDLEAKLRAEMGKSK